MNWLDKHNKARVYLFLVGALILVVMSITGLFFPINLLWGGVLLLVSVSLIFMTIRSGRRVSKELREAEKQKALKEKKAFKRVNKERLGNFIKSAQAELAKDGIFLAYWPVYSSGSLPGYFAESSRLPSGIYLRIQSSQRDGRYVDLSIHNVLTYRRDGPDFRSYDNLSKAVGHAFWTQAPLFQAIYKVEDLEAKDVAHMLLPGLKRYSELWNSVLVFKGELETRYEQRETADLAIKLLKDRIKSSLGIGESIVI